MQIGHSTSSMLNSSVYFFSNSSVHSTAIAKGKWCTTEWKDEINYLAEKYNIDLSVRGER